MVKSPDFARRISILRGRFNGYFNGSMVLRAPRSAAKLGEAAGSRAGAGEIRIRVERCAVAGRILHVIEASLPQSLSHRTGTKLSAIVDRWARAPVLDDWQRVGFLVGKDLRSCEYWHFQPRESGDARHLRM